MEKGPADGGSDWQGVDNKEMVQFYENKKERLLQGNIETLRKKLDDCEKKKAECLAKQSPASSLDEPVSASGGKKRTKRRRQTKKRTKRRKTKRRKTKGKKTKRR